MDKTRFRVDLPLNTNQSINQSINQSCDQTFHTVGSGKFFLQSVRSLAVWPESKVVSGIACVLQIINVTWADVCYAGIKMNNIQNYSQIVDVIQAYGGGQG